MANKNIPQLRFAGFDGEWSKQPIYDISSRRKIINNGMQETNLLSLSYGKIKRKDINQKTGLLPASYETYQIVEDGTIVFRFTDLQNDQKSLRVGLSNERGIVSSAYVCVDGNSEKVIPNFFYWLLHFYDTQKVFYKMGAGIRQSINADDLKELTLKLPSLEEQVLLQKQCDSIDKIILEQQEKCNQLRKLKSALIDKLFPSDGQSAPEMRLEGFSEPWREVSFSDIFTTISQKGFPNLPILSASQEFGMIPRSENGIDMSYGTQNVTGYKRVQPGQFVIHLRSFQGGFAHSAIEGITSPAYTVLKFIDASKHNENYWKYVLVSDAFIKMLESVTYGIRDGKSIKFEDVSKLTFMIPSYDEQCAIAEILTQQDNLINLNNKKLAHLQRIKSAILDKLFV